MSNELPQQPPLSEDLIEVEKLLEVLEERTEREATTAPWVNAFQTNMQPLSFALEMSEHDVSELEELQKEYDVLLRRIGELATRNKEEGTLPEDEEKKELYAAYRTLAQKILLFEKYGERAMTTVVLLKKALENARARTEAEFQKNVPGKPGNKWTACFRTDMSVITFSLQILEEEKVIDSPTYERIIAEVRGLDAKALDLEKIYPTSETIPTDEEKEVLFRSLEDIGAEILSLV